MKQRSISDIRRELGHDKVYGGQSKGMKSEAFIVIRTGIYKPEAESDLDQWEFGMFAWPTADPTSLP